VAGVLWIHGTSREVYCVTIGVFFRDTHWVVASRSNINVSNPKETCCLFVSLDILQNKAFSCLRGKISKKYGIFPYIKADDAVVALCHDE